MNDKKLEQQIRHSLNAELSRLNTSSWQRDRFFENATGGYKVKRKLTYGLVLAIVLLLAAATAVAVALLSAQEVVEQVAVPMAQENDPDWRVNMQFSPEELAAFIRAANENGITIDENDDIMRALQNGEGYDEEEAIMEVCRQAFGGIYSFWTLEQKHWFDEMMVAIGFADGPVWSMPGEGDLTEEEAKTKLIAAIQDEFNDEMYRADHDEEMDLADGDRFLLALDYYPEAAKDGTVWHIDAWPRDAERNDYYTASLDKVGNVLNVIARNGKNPYAQSLETSKPVRSEEETQTDAGHSETENRAWIKIADLSSITADNIMKRTETVYGPESEWSSETWAEVAAAAADLPARTMEGRIVKATPWIAWHEGLLTLEQAEEQAFRRTGMRIGEYNCACLIDSKPNPVWKFRLMEYSGEYRDMVVEIDAVTGEITDLDMYKADHYELEPPYHRITLHRIWAALELAENGPLYLARLAIIHTFADLSFDMPEEDSLPIFKETFWKPEVSGNTVYFHSCWSNFPDYRVTLDEYGVPSEVAELPSGGTETLPPEQMPGAEWDE